MFAALKKLQLASKAFLSPAYFLFFHN